MEGLAGSLRSRCAEEVGYGSAEGGWEAGGAGFEDSGAAEDGVDVVEGGRDGGLRQGGDGGKLTLGPFHDDQNAVDVTIHVGEESGEFERQSLQTLAQIIEAFGDDRRRGHVGCSHRLPKIPHCNPCFPQVTYLSCTVLRIKDERLERSREASYFDKVRYRW